MSPAAKRSYDVIIVGAGPAGSTLGRELAGRGIEVLVLEKQRLPRPKPCAGGITVKAARLLDFDLSPVTQQVIYGVRAVYKGRREFTRWYDRPLVYAVMRQEFDHFLVQKAQEAGAVVADNQRVCHVRTTAAGVEAQTADGEFAAQIVAGADGANGVVARGLGLATGVERGIGMEAQVSVAGEGLAKWDSLMGLSLGQIRGGYGWILPKKDHLSVGVGGRLRQAKKLRPCWEKVLAYHRLDGNQATGLRSDFLPVLKSGSAIQKDRCLLLGDAAGLVDPLTGEGICHAIGSAQIAAPVVEQCLRSGAFDLSGYQDALAEELMPELRAARALARLFAWFPGLYFHAIRRSDRLWRASCRLLRGEESYISLRRRLGAFRFLFDILST